jgi:L-alanine-DL-glutamate epimerase-like enolase superfamily enzyme
MDASFERLELPLDRAFTIARGTTEVAENVLVRIEHEGTTGVGAAAPAAHYGETADTVAAVLPELLAAIEDVDPLNLDRAERAMRETVRDNPAARAAVSVALHDLAAKRLDVPLYSLLGLDPERTVTSSFTVGLDDPEAMAEAAGEAAEAGYGVLKVKLGTDRDRAILAAVRGAAPDVRLRVDANGAWTPREAAEKSVMLHDHDVEFCEQPVPGEDVAGLRFVREHGAVPVAADESCVTLEDVPRVADACDVVNLKLMKCGGVREAVRMVHTARAHGLEVMLGCMVETNAAIAAACHLAPLLDYADLDGSLLLADDPYDGVPMPGGRIDLPGVERGTGARA